MTAPATNARPLRVDCVFPHAQERFAGHFPRQAVIPGAALVDRVLAEVERATGQRVSAIRQVKFVAAALPQDALVLQGSATDALVRFELLRQTDVICLGTLALESSS